ncbi:MAG: DUF4296 domain-containing protein [Flavobacteriales bacterium]|nr:DUF4296 domain-containing protein [Flavobacteriales bacterium]
MILSATGCSEDSSQEKPSFVLSEKKMIAVLTDIQLVEGAISKKILDKNSTRKESPLYYQKAFEKHTVTREQFDESISYYTENPKEMQAIYEKVLVELSKIKVELQNTKKKTVEETK